MTIVGRAVVVAAAVAGSVPGAVGSAVGSADTVVALVAVTLPQNVQPTIELLAVGAVCLFKKQNLVDGAYSNDPHCACALHSSAHVAAEVAFWV